MTEGSPFACVTSFPESMQPLPYSMPALCFSKRVLSLLALINLATIAYFLLCEVPETLFP